MQASLTDMVRAPQVAAKLWGGAYSLPPTDIKFSSLPERALRGFHLRAPLFTARSHVGGRGGLHMFSRSDFQAHPGFAGQGTNVGVLDVLLVAPSGQLTSEKMACCQTACAVGAAFLPAWCRRR